MTRTEIHLIALGPAGTIDYLAADIREAANMVDPKEAANRLGIALGRLPYVAKLIEKAIAEMEAKAS